MDTIETLGPLGQALECSVCLEQLDTSSRVLPCQHTFCKSCLLDILNTRKELRCPECRVLVTVPFNELPQNILLLRILEGIKKIPFSVCDTSSSSNLPSLFETPSTYGGTVSGPIFTSPTLAKTTSSPNDPFSDILSSNLSLSALNPIVHSKVFENNPSHSTALSTNPFLSSNTQMLSFESLSTKSISTLQSHLSNSLIQSVPAYTHTQPTDSLENYFLSPPKTPDRFHPPVHQFSQSFCPPQAFSPGSFQNTQYSGMFVPRSTSGQIQHNSSPSLFQSSSGLTSNPFSSLPTNIQFCASGRMANISVANLHSPVQSSQHSTEASLISSNSVSFAALNQSSCNNQFSAAAAVTSETSLSNKRLSQNIDFSSSGSEEGRNQLSSEEQFKYCSSLIEKGCSRVFPVNTLARAIFSYEKREPRDLNFKKGDLIQVRKKIDENWFQGELGGQLGFFPASYVKILDALPSNIPQCKALYDFKMTPQGERDCLVFSKGDVITVLRRIDENWAEGKMQGRIGIFPLSFVEFNTHATTLMQLTSNQPNSSNATPPLPDNAFSLSKETKSTSFSDNSVSSSFLSPSISPSPLGSTKNDSLSSPFSQSQKRHSFADASSFCLGKTVSPIHKRNSQAIGTSAESSSAPGSVGDEAVRISASIGIDTSNTKKVQQSSENGTTSTLQFYTALYSYHPRKADELELKKGNVYFVSDKCQDGWYKGRCILTDKIGVFPGNYVALAKLQTLAAYQAKLNKKNAGGVSPSSSSNIPSYRQKSFVNSLPANARQNLPPELPPRHAYVSSSSSTLPATVQSASNGLCSPSFISPGTLQPNAERKVKDKLQCNGGGTGGMALMRKLTGNKKKCKSPPVFSIENPILEDSSRGLSTIIQSRFRCIAPYPPNSEDELELRVGDIIYVHKKQEDGWYKGTLQRDNKTGLFPASFVERL